VHVCNCLHDEITIAEQSDLVERVGRQCCDVDGFGMQEGRLFGLSQQQQLRHHAIHPVQLVVDQGDRRGDVSRVGGIKHVQMPPDDRDRRAQLVARVVDEPPLGSNSGLHPVQHAVDGGYQVAEFVAVTATARDALRQIGFGDGPRRVGDIPQRTQNSSGHQPRGANRSQQSDRTNDQHEPGGRVGIAAFSICQVGRDDHTPRRIPRQSHRHSGVHDLAELRISIRAPSGIVDRRDPLGEVGVTGQRRTTIHLAPALDTVLAVDVTEKLLVGPGDVVGDRFADHLVDVRERHSGSRVHTRRGQLGELLHLEAQLLLHTGIRGGDEQSPRHEGDQAQRGEHQQQHPSDDSGACGRWKHAVSQPNPSSAGSCVSLGRCCSRCGRLRHRGPHHRRLCRLHLYGGPHRRSSRSDRRLPVAVPERR